MSTPRNLDMALAGKGVVAIWHGIRPEGRAEFYEWHNREHMPERVGIPGFLRGRRYIAHEGAPEFFTLYETATPEVLAGADYLARLNAPTEWTRRATRHFTDTSRSLCRVVLSLGPGAGGWLMTWRYDVAPGREHDQRARLEPALEDIAQAPGIVGAHLCIADAQASAIETEEKKGRPKNAVPGWVVLVEGGAERDALQAACQRLATPAFFTQAGAFADVQRGLYQLQNAILPAC
jgi:glutathione S-transferase